MKSFTLQLAIPDECQQDLEELVHRALVDALLAEERTRSVGFLNVDGAAALLASTPAAIRSLVKTRRIPYHKAPNGRLLFDRRELEAWVRSG